MAGVALNQNEVVQSVPPVLGSAPLTPMRAVSLTKPFNTLLGKVPPSALSVPSMMSTAERRFLYSLAQSYYSGQGLIIDAGLFLGASTRCFGEGLLANTNYKRPLKGKSKPIQSFERGLVNPGMPAFFDRNQVQFDGKLGESFEPVLEANVKPVEALVNLRVGDILQSPEMPDPIEICYLDVLKSEELAYFCVSRYFPKLIPGVSIVLQQDYFFDGLPFIKVYQEHLAEYFEYVGEICSMAVFKCIAQVPPITAPLEKTLSHDEQLRLCSVALQRSVDPTRRFMMAVSKLRLVRKLRGLDDARNYLAFIESEYPDQIAMAAQKYIRLRDIWRAAQKLATGSEKVEKVL